MKGDISNLITRRESRTSVSAVSVNTPDYLITTMKLRDMVLTARAPAQGSHRKTIRNMRSAPPFQNRNLDNYPMSYKREDAVRSARGFRAEKRETSSRVVKERVDSGLMRDYSKQMFDFSVKTVNSSNGYRNYEKSAQNSTKPIPEQEQVSPTRTNGPTPDGSILHNRRQKVLNSIRIRPHPDYESQFHHERTCSRQSLQNTISDKNRHYRVRSVTSECIRPVSVMGNVSIASGDFIFEPLDQNAEDFCRANTACTRRATLDTPMSTYDELDSIDGVFGKDPFDDVDGRSEISGSGAKCRSKRPSVPALLPPDVVCNIRLVSLDEPSSSESEAEKEEPVPEVKKPEPPPPPPPKSRGKKNDKKNRKKVKIVVVEEEKKIPEPEPEPEPVKVKLILKGPHCWVDDATITSDQSEDEKEENPDVTGSTEQPQNSNGLMDKLNSTQKTENASKVKTMMKNAVANNGKPSDNNILKQPNQQAMKNAFEKALENVQSKPNETINNNNNTENVGNNTMVASEELKAEVENVIDDNEEEVKLPPFLCPSSEKKSRQAALKDWLAHTCFETGHTGVPIV